MVDKLRYVPIWVDYHGEEELHSVIISPEEEDTIKQAIVEAETEVKKEDPEWNIDMIVERVSEKIDVIESEELRGVLI